MNRFLLLLMLTVISQSIYAQYIYTIKADSVKITNTCDTAELIIENHTQTVPGFLYNKGRGRTEFRRVMQKINDTLVTIGADSLKLPYAWLQGGNRFGTIGKFGTLDNNPIDYYTNDTVRGRWAASGNLIVGNTIDNGSKFQVNGSSYFNGPQRITGTFSAAIGTAHTYFNPAVTMSGTDGDYASGFAINPTINFGGNSQNGNALVIAPTYNLNGKSQHPDAISAALKVQSVLGGIEIDQNSALPGNSGQPLYIYQRGDANKEAIYNYRNGVLTTLPFIWNHDNRPVGNKGAIVPAMRNSIITPDAGAGVSFTLDRRYYTPTDASMELKYENRPASDTVSTVNTSIVFNTRSAGVPVIPLYLKSEKVGIGTTTPGAQLHTTGSVRFAGLTNDNSLTRIVVSDADGNLYYRDASSLALNGTINSDLAVNGTIAAQKMLISQTGRWPDYVFSRQYQLPSLTEVENFINGNNHLPGIPSAAEVKEKGIDVAVNQAALLKKIEELTLYAIEQEKKLEKQSEEISELKDQNKELISLKQEMTELKALIQSH